MNNLFPHIIPNRLMGNSLLRILFLFLILCSLFPLYCKAQGTGDLLERAYRDYHMGSWDSSLVRLDRYLHSGQKIESEYKWEAYRLMTLNNFYLDSLKQTKKNLRRMIRLNPYYVPSIPKDPSDFVLYYKNHKIQGKAIGFKAGSNFSLAQVLLFHPANGSIDTSINSLQYESQAGFHLGLIGELRASTKIWYTQEIQINSRSVSLADPAFPGTLSNYKETQRFLEIPMSFRFEFGQSQLIPYFRMGICPSYMASSKVKLSTNINSPVTFNFLSSRNRFQLDPMVGLGINLRTTGGVYALETRYRQGLFNVVLPDKRFSSQYAIFNFLFSDNDFLMSSIELSLSFTRSHFGLKEKKYEIFKKRNTK